MLWEAFAGKEISEEEGGMPLMPSWCVLYMFGCGWVVVLVFALMFT